MAIVKMNKFTLLTFESKKEELLRKLQGFSNVEFINLQDENLLEANEELKSLSKDEIDSNIAKYEEDLSKAKTTLDFLTNYMPKKSGLKALEDDKEDLTIDELDSAVKNINWNEIYEKVKLKEDELHNIESQITKLEGEIEVLTPWQALDISFEALNELKTVSTFIGSISKGRTVKQTILGGYVFGLGGTFTSFIILGNYSLGLQVSGRLDVMGLYNASQDLYSTIIAIINTLPMAQIVLILLALAMITFYATSFDAIALVASAYSYKELPDGQEPHMGVKVFWSLMLILLPIALVFSDSSMANLQTVSIIAAFPLAAVILLIVASFLKDGKKYLEENRK